MTIYLMHLPDATPTAGVAPGEDPVPVEIYIAAVIAGLIVVGFLVAMFIIFRRFQSKSERKNSVFQVHKHTEDIS